MREMPLLIFDLADKLAVLKGFRSLDTAGILSLIVVGVVANWLKIRKINYREMKNSKGRHLLADEFDI